MRYQRMILLVFNFMCYPYGWQKKTGWLFILWAYVYCVPSEKYGEEVLCQRKKKIKIIRNIYQ